MKTAIPESWNKFHRLVLAHQNGGDYALTKLYEQAHCASDLPAIYKKLGWVIMGDNPKMYQYAGPKTEIITPKMADQIRKNWGESKYPIKQKNIDSIPEWKMPTLEETGEAIKERRARELQKFWDGDLVTELRRRGYEVTAVKIVEL